MTVAQTDAKLLRSDLQEPIIHILRNVVTIASEDVTNEKRSFTSGIDPTSQSWQSSSSQSGFLVFIIIAVWTPEQRQKGLSNTTDCHVHAESDADTAYN